MFVYSHETFRGFHLKLETNCLNVYLVVSITKTWDFYGGLKKLQENKGIRISSQFAINVRARKTNIQKYDFVFCFLAILVLLSTLEVEIIWHYSV